MIRSAWGPSVLLALPLRTLDMPGPVLPVSAADSWRMLRKLPCTLRAKTNDSCTAFMAGSSQTTLDEARVRLFHSKCFEIPDRWDRQIADSLRDKAHQRNLIRCNGVSSSVLPTPTMRASPPQGRR